MNLGNEEVAKVAYVLGSMYEELPEKYDSWDECYLLIKQITYDWLNHVDIKTNEEEGYIQAYAERIISEIVKEGEQK